MPKNLNVSLSDPLWSTAIRQWWVLLTLVFLLLMGEYVGALLPLRSSSELGWRGLLARTNRVSYLVWQPVLTWQNRRTQIFDQETLLQKYNQALVTITELETLRSENETLKNLVSSNQIKNESLILAVPIMAYGQPLIAAGSQEGVKGGASVLVGQTLVGVVSQVSQHQSTVALLTQESSPVVLARTEGGVTGVLKGDGKRILMTEIPIDIKVNVGERVVTKGQAGIQPNILIGTVTEVKAEPSSSVQVAVVTQLVSFYESSLVEIQ